MGLEYARELTFEMPMPLDVRWGIGISAIFLIGFMYYTLGVIRVPLPRASFFLPITQYVSAHIRGVLTRVGVRKNVEKD